MIKYFRSQITYFKIDTDKNEIISITNHPENKGIVYSFGTEMIAQSMLDSLNTQLGVLKPGGWMTVEIQENEFLQAKAEAKAAYISGSIDF